MLSMASGVPGAPKVFAGTSLDKARRIFGRVTERRDALTLSATCAQNSFLAGNG
jgi:hypothetical protein